MKKRVVSILLVSVLLFVMLPLSALAESRIPVIVIGGYSNPQIYLFDGNGYEEENIQEKVWGLSLSKALDYVKQDIPNLTKANINALLERSNDRIFAKLSDAVAEIAKYMRRNPDGTPVYDTGTWPRSAEESNMAYINAHKDTDEYVLGSIREKRFMPTLCEKIGEKNVYSFSVDWRQNQIECARDLGLFIQKVRAHAGAAKVNILCESHGGETTSSYISMAAIVKKGGENAAVLAKLLDLAPERLPEIFNLDYLNNVTMDSPAIGVQLAYDLVTGNAHFDAPRLIAYLEYANNPLRVVTSGDEYTWESDYEMLLGGLTLDNLNRLANMLIQRTDVIQIMMSFGSMWDFIPRDKYDEVKALWLDTAEKQAAYQPMIEKSDYDHYVIMPNMSENLNLARKNGVNVNIVCGTDLTCVSGSRVNGDSLVNVCDASGAKVTAYGSRFSNGYHTDYNDSAVVCTDPTHDHVAPRMNIDAAYAYLPENTWFIEEQYHAMYVTDAHCQALIEWLLLTDKPVDIYSDPDTFPQFDVTHNGKMGVRAAFDHSVYGTLTKADTALVIENLSGKSNLELVAIKAEDLDVTFENVYGTKIPRGERVTLKMTGEIPDTDMQPIRLTLYYLEDASVFSMGSRTQTFTIKGGKAIAYDEANPLTEAKERPLFVTPQDILNGLQHYDTVMVLKAITISAVVLMKAAISLIKSAFKK